MTALNTTVSLLQTLTSALEIWVAHQLGVAGGWRRVRLAAAGLPAAR